MESSLIQRNHKRIKRAARVRRSLKGSATKPRLCVMKSNQHIAAQLIDDEAGVTLASANTLMKHIRGKVSGNNKDAARIIGTELAERAKEKNITTVVFDRGFNKYHGVIAELANAARAGGLQF
ncbi:50S ribosomal protein L18 [Rhabdochlamydiaceae symbiont of Dictyostelium giganteum]|uniref:50S ribosomal protein L18 n=1 Tax=Rhabdochlamydiaceae symbiont of Dictyostelium giganteum TaxID=3342349 RepID=UPI00384C49B6